ncbi:hypothetical protein GUITHDRAFT_144803 [Guillardia theta CCMP2712]|uniref:Uncharacterized protein n=1 Tax=Guillardia theta (strain CCMP2712) TaxID=905079 RepID=L1IN15_GUITC|nr:hypothetical protein GUITHDRAFT_144803 [Guillardia theta CCMP2712]EKX37676.1 hypothetical protein GUITHDRAFT_144803 [Guillardia theta CCMP2712]|eukprot:XP_005824656.1 hypothetical protein GUITHDRAFT_144803 [Guillardia theta CCMP2712]
MARRLADFSNEGEGIVWNASLLLLNYFRSEDGGAELLLITRWDGRTNMKEEIKGKRILELGAGVGHLAWGLYEMGAQVTATNTSLGDLDVLGANIKQWKEEEERGVKTGGREYIVKCIGGSMEERKVEGGSISVEELTWGEQYWDQSPLSRAGDVKFDIVILAEVFSIPEVIVYSIFMNRPFSFMFLAHLADAGGFRVHQYKETEFDKCGMDDDELHIMMHRYTYDPE